MTAAVEGRKVKVKGPKGSLEREFSDLRYDDRVSIALADGAVKVTAKDEKRKTKAFAGTAAAHMRNMVAGVLKGWKYKMKIFHTHFPITVEVKDSEVQVKNFLGQKSVLHAKVIGNTKVEVKKDEISVTGTDLEAVAQTAANIETTTRLSGKDRRVFLDGVYIAGWEHQTE